MGIHNSCCFIGHRKIDETENLRAKLYKSIEKLVKYENVNTFIFGSKSGFNDLCYRIVTDLKQKYPHIKRIYMRAEFPIISDVYKNYLLQCYEHTYYPETIIGSGKAVYVKRNCEMVAKSSFCVFYYDENVSKKRKSGTKIALDYAVKQKRQIINLYQKTHL